MIYSVSLTNVGRENISALLGAPGRKCTCSSLIKKQRYCSFPASAKKTVVAGVKKKKKICTCLFFVERQEMRQHSSCHAGIQIFLLFDTEIHQQSICAC